jgi:hypothetical protein
MLGLLMTTAALLSSEALFANGARLVESEGSGYPQGSAIVQFSDSL